MKKVILLLFAALTLGVSGRAQTQTFQVTETGWGRIEKAVKQGIPVASAIGEMNIPRWRKTSGTLTVDKDKREAVLSLKRKKDKTFQLLTERPAFVTRDGWTYVEYEAMDDTHSTSRFWLGTHESGARRLLTLYPYNAPNTVYGYSLTPEE